MKQFLQPASLPIGSLGVILPVLGLVLLGLIVSLHPTLLVWDNTLLLYLHQYATPDWNRHVAIATDLGTQWGVFPAALLLTLLLLWRRQWRSAVYLSLAMLGSITLNPVLKLLWHRVRPALWEGVPPLTSFSYPSGHATHSMTLVAAVILLHWHSPKRPWLLLWGSLFVLVIGLTRVYLGVHYPSDILGGWLLAIAWIVGLSQLLLPRHQSAPTPHADPSSPEPLKG